jgi:uncharacterized membrane protein
MKKLIVAAVLSAAAVVAPTTGASAGEVKGPSELGVPNSEKTGALDHAQSECAASGLNDFIDGQKVSRVQTAADSWKYYGLPKGSPGTLGLCRGSSS